MLHYNVCTKEPPKKQNWPSTLLQYQNPVNKKSTLKDASKGHSKGSLKATLMSYVSGLYLFFPEAHLQLRLQSVEGLFRGRQLCLPDSLGFYSDPCIGILRFIRFIRPLEGCCHGVIRLYGVSYVGRVNQGGGCCFWVPSKVQTE